MAWFCLIKILLGQGAGWDEDEGREPETGNEVSGEQRTRREKFREVTLGFHRELTRWGFITTESSEVPPSLDTVPSMVS